MSEKKGLASATLVGDVRGSRRTDDRRRLHGALTKVLAEANDRLAPVDPLRLTVGDEYQGRFATVGEALAATLWLRLALLPDHDVRHGVGWGPVRLLQEEPLLEDGPGWWAARDAIVEAEQFETRPALRAVRTAYRLGEALVDADRAAALDPSTVNAALMLRDQIVSGLSARSVSVLRGLLDDRPQQELAAELKVSASAVSQRVRHDGLAVVLAAHEALRDANRKETR